MCQKYDKREEMRKEIASWVNTSASFLLLLFLDSRSCIQFL